MKKIGIRNLFKKKIMKGTNTNSDTGVFLANLRKEKNLNQKDIANMLNVSVQAVSKWENSSGIPDFQYQKKLCDFYKITLDELHMGNYDYKKRKQHKINLFINWFSLTLLLVCLPILILLSIYFFTHYDSVHIYRIYNSDNKSINDISIKGLYIDIQDLNVIYLGNISMKNYNIKDSDLINVEIFYNDKLISYSNDYKHITATYNTDNFNINNIKIVVSLNNDEYSTNLNIENLLDNNSDENNLSKLNFKSDEEIIENLEKEGFKKLDDTHYILNAKDNINETNVTIDMKSKSILFIQKDNLIEKYILVRIPNNIFNVIIYQNDSIKTILEKYTINTLSNKINCIAGSCLTSKEVDKTMEKYINLLIVE